MKKLLITLSILFLFTTTSFAQGEYLKDNEHGFSIGTSVGVSDNVRILTGQIGLSVSRLFDIGIEGGQASYEYGGYGYGFSGRRSMGLFGIYSTIHLSNAKESKSQLSLSGAFTKDKYTSAILLNPTFTFDISTSSKLFISPGYYNDLDISTEDNMFISYGFSPYFEWNKGTLFIIKLSGAHTSEINTFSIGFGFLFGFGEEDKVDINEKTDETKDKKKKKKKKRKKKKGSGSYYDR